MLKRLTFVFLLVNVFGLLFFVFVLTKGWMDMTQLECCKYFSFGGNILYMYFQNGVYIHFFSIIGSGLFILSRSESMGYPMLRQVLKLSTDTWLFAALIIFSLLMYFHVKFYPLITIPDFRSFYSADIKQPKNIAVYLKREKGQKKIVNLIEIQKPLEIHNYYLLKSYLSNKKTADEALIYLRKKMYLSSNDSLFLIVKDIKQPK